MSFATKALRREGFFFCWLCFEKVSKVGVLLFFFNRAKALSRKVYSFGAVSFFLLLMFILKTTAIAPMGGKILLCPPRRTQKIGKTAGNSS